MALGPVNVTRTSHYLRAFNLLNTVQARQLDLFRMQNQLATGLRFSAPSQDPARAADAIRVDHKIDVLNQIDKNLIRANEALREGEIAAQEAVDLANEAHALSLSMTDDSHSEDERQAMRIVVESMLDKLITIGNRQYLDTYIFGGNYGNSAPFERIDDGVIYRGDDGRVRTILDTDLAQDAITMSGMEFFNAVSDSVRGYVDLDPVATSESRLRDLNGATGAGVSTGRIRVSDGTTEADIDLTGCDTVGDVVDRLNADLPATLQASLSNNAISIEPVPGLPADITVTDIAGGNAAVELGISADTPVAALIGSDLDPRITPRTRVDTLGAGAGIDLSSGIRITNGSEQAVVTFDGVATIEDVLNRINQSGTGVLAQIADDGASIEVRNRVSGADLHIEENGGDVAHALGIRTMHEGTRLAALNDGQGLHTVDGDDFRISLADGTTVDVDLDQVDIENGTLQDVLALINAAGGGALTASLRQSGNGILIEDNTAGSGQLHIERLNVSPAIDGLGLDVVATGNQLVGDDVNPVKVNSAFTALLELNAALHGDDTRDISAAAQRLFGNLEHLQEQQGAMAAQAATVLERTDRMDNEMTAARVLQSDIRDVDFTEALVRFQSVQTALEANYATSSRIMRLSLFDYLR